MKFQFIQDHREYFPVRLMCRVLEASPSGFYDWLRRPESPRAAEDQALVAKIQVVHSESRQTYGSPRVHASLKAEGYRIGRNRVARLMRKNDIRAQDQAQVPGHHRRLPRSSGRAQPAGPAVHGRGAEHGLAG